MTHLALVFACILGYLALGVLHARAHAVDVYRTAFARAKEWHSECTVMDSVRARFRWAMAARTLAWPFAIAGDAIGGLYMGPVREQQQRAGQLRQDAAQWRDRTRTATTAEEREMAAELARLCEERAKEIGL